MCGHLPCCGPTNSQSLLQPHWPDRAVIHELLIARTNLSRNSAWHVRRMPKRCSLLLSPRTARYVLAAAWLCFASTPGRIAVARLKRQPQARPPPPRQPQNASYEGTQAGQTRDDNSLKLKFIWCPAGQFKMGSGHDQVDVTLSQGFSLGKYEVTQDEFRQVLRARNLGRTRRASGRAPTTPPVTSTISSQSSFAESSTRTSIKPDGCRAAGSMNCRPRHSGDIPARREVRRSSASAMIKQSSASTPGLGRPPGT